MYHVLCVPSIAKDQIFIDILKIRNLRGISVLNMTKIDYCMFVIVFYMNESLSTNPK